MEIAVVLFVIAAIFITRAVKVVPQQNAWVVERLGKYHGSLSPGLNFLMPFIDKVAYKHSLKEIPLDVPSQVCITRDNTQLQVDGILYFQVTDPMRASYGSSNYIMAVTQLAQTSLRSVIGKLELDKTFEERDIINAQIVQAIDEAALNWGVKVLRYEIKDLTPPKEILHAMQAQITAEREKRALIAASEGRRQEQINIATGERRQLKQQPVIGYDPAKYETERLWATARDGTKIPVSLVYRKGYKKDGTAALLQYAYGSYGNSIDPTFNLPAVSLLDRGVVYAIAHIRGGQEMGRAWYDAGKLLNKKNTFTDFIDVTRFLVEQGVAAPDRVAAYGGSAGGLLMGAIANMAPQDYRVILSQVPFVDVVTTMLDASIPLTTNEYDEWGNPEDAQYYDYMLSYSPYDNLTAQAYPATFVGTGLWDSQVQYWEPAKYVAKLRDVNTGTEPVVFRTNMDAGHGGKSGRFRRYREMAEMYAFALDRLGVADTASTPASAAKSD